MKYMKFRQCVSTSTDRKSDCMPMEVCFWLLYPPSGSTCNKQSNGYTYYIYTQPKHITFIVTDQPKNKAGAESNSAVQYISWNQRTGIDLRSRGKCSIYEI